MKVVAVPTNKNGPLARELQRLRRPGATHGHEVVTYASLDELLATLKSKVRGREDCIEVLEISAHGSPRSCNEITPDTAQRFAEQLGLLNALCPNCKIYLSGCNTGLGRELLPIPKLIANITGCKVYATVGYTSGTHAEGNTRSTKRTRINGRDYPEYPGAQDASGDQCYKEFTKG